MKPSTLGMVLMVGAMFVFGTQDALSRYLAEAYSVLGVLLIRYWFFAGFVIVRAMRAPCGLRQVVRSHRPVLQSLRGVMLVVQVWMMVKSFTLLGLVEAHAIFACYPLIIAALAGPVLGERVTLRRWIAIGAGAAGVLLILRPGAGLFAPASLLVLLAALNFAAYGLLTRVVGLHDPPETSFFYTGMAGAVAITLPAPWIWAPIAFHDWFWMGLLCLSGSMGHYLLIRALSISEASRLQPLAYFQLIFASAAGVIVFGEHLQPLTVAGAALVVAAGLFNLRASR
ncbi:DMT family transporter [Roseococcus sp. SYP-B2431]|uniref:DMT family transporter n=1 Tax=Roseococcus sp. SYP-B2431 TaxID=2496640 RepID=UPI00197DA5A2|nr:DMT family transporter [Roseococcus sp. SYP-B2431]